MHMRLNATHAPDCQEASNDIRVRTNDRGDEAPAGSGDVHEWKECIPCWLRRPRTAGTNRRADTNTNSLHAGCLRLTPDASFTKIHLISPHLYPPIINQSQPFICLHQARLCAIIAAVPENNLTWLCVSMATGPTSVAVSPLPVYICNYQQRLQRRDRRNERRRRFFATRWFKMWSCSVTGYFY